MCFSVVIYHNIASPENCHYGTQHNLPFKLSKVMGEFIWKDIMGKCYSTTKGSREDKD